MLALAEDGATVPFIARYRKERTGNLDEVAIQDVLNGLKSWKDFMKRKTFVKCEIERQKKMTPALLSKIEGCSDVAAVEELYLPFKVRAMSNAQKAIDAGLQPLADTISSCAQRSCSLQDMARCYFRPQVCVCVRVCAYVSVRSLCLYSE